jgi:hypothetical protein
MKSLTKQDYLRMHFDQYLKTKNSSEIVLIYYGMHACIDTACSCIYRPSRVHAQLSQNIIYKRNYKCK